MLQQQPDVDESTTNSADVGDENGANDDHDEDEDGTGNGNANGSSMLVDEDSDEEVTFNQSSVHQVWPMMKLYYHLRDIVFFRSFQSPFLGLFEHKQRP